MSLQSFLVDLHGRLIRKTDNWQVGHDEQRTDSPLCSPSTLRQNASAESCLRALGVSCSALIESLEQSQEVCTSMGMFGDPLVPNSGSLQGPGFQTLHSQIRASIACFCDILNEYTDAVQVGCLFSP
jgi:hypothetical protein